VREQNIQAFPEDRQFSDSSSRLDKDFVPLSCLFALPAASPGSTPEGVVDEFAVVLDVGFSIVETPESVRPYAWAVGVLELTPGSVPGLAPVFPYHRR
jgi:hypothetical protein